MRSVLGVLLCCGLGCATAVAPRGTLPVHPSDADVANDGTPQQQQALFNRYRVTVEADRVEVGDARRPAGVGLAGAQVDPDIKAYLGNEDVNFPSSFRGVMVGSGFGLLAASVVLAFVVMPLPFLVGLGWIVGLEITAQRVVQQPTLRPNAIPIAIFLSLLGTLALQAVASVLVSPAIGTLLAGSVLVDLARRQTHGEVEAAARRYNETLRRRIEAAGNIQVQTPAAAEAPVTPDAQP